MEEVLSDRRLVENQVYFRQPNEKVVQDLKKLKKMADETGQAHMLPELDTPVQFYCECSDENCRERIKLKPSEYSDLHQNGSQFVILPGHNVPKIERITQSETDYVVVEKYKAPPNKVFTAKPTSLSNG